MCSRRPGARQPRFACRSDTSLSAVSGTDNVVRCSSGVQGLSYEEIGVELGVSVAAVETLIFRARRSVGSRARTFRDEAVPSRRRRLPSPSSRWFFRGGVTPVKLAAAAAALRRRALAVAPVVRAAADAAARRVDRLDGDEARACGQASSARGAHDVRRLSTPKTSTESLTPSALWSTPVDADWQRSADARSARRKHPGGTQRFFPLPLPVSVPDVVNAPTLTVPVVDPGLSFRR